MKALVISPVCPLQLHPTLQCELADEVLLGMTVEVLEEPCPGWYFVEAPYRYRGYAPGESLLLGDGLAARWAALPKAAVLRGICTVLAAPSVQSWPLTTLVRGALVAPAGACGPDGWQKISLPDGREGYIRKSYLGTWFTAPSAAEESVLREHLVQSGLSYLGTHYRWGGKSPLGIDCSGLCSMAYLLNGVVLYRDAAIREGFPLHPIPRSKLDRGDLLFFPGHVALYLGGHRYLHATAHPGSDGVVISSLDPASPDYRPDLEGKLTALGSIF